MDRSVLERMNTVIRHRGPDSDGFHIKGNVGLAMRRLAIIDLSTGDQPLCNEDGTIWIVFNGEIYNYQALRKELEAFGHVFRTHGDTEAIVHAYEQYGEDCVQHLRGMFAFAIWDERREQLFVARDRVGKKPLYYAEHDGVLLFGSELKCILQYPGFPREADWEAIHHYLTLQYVPDPWSAFRHIRKLPPAHTLVWRSGEVRIKAYWKLNYEPKRRLPEAELKRQVREKVTEAVRIRLMSEVPLGAHLSGGVDSTIIVGLMAGMMDQPVKTFSVGFAEGGFNELPFAKQVSQRFGTDHHEFILKPDALDVLPKMVDHFDEPNADPAAIPMWYLSQLTRQHVTVALNGDGGDEAFAGYQRYYGDRIADLYRLVPGWARHGLIDQVLGLLPIQTDRPMERSWVMALRRLSQAADLSHAASIVRWGDYFSEAEKWGMYTDDMRTSLHATPTHGLLEETFHAALARHRVDRTLQTDIAYYLAGDLLPKVDRMTMAHSLEARSPFLDHEVMELAAVLPVEWKVRGNCTKRILRETFADLLPGDLGTRGKTGFGVPLGEWFRGALAGSATEILLDSGAKALAVIQRSSMEKLLKDHRQGKADHGKRIWALLVLETWLKRCLAS